jgi:hypothetical protein
VAAATGVRAPGRMLELQVKGRAELPAFAPAAANRETRE